MNVGDKVNASSTKFGFPVVSGTITGIINDTGNESLGPRTIYNVRPDNGGPVIAVDPYYNNGNYDKIVNGINYRF